MKKVKKVKKVKSKPPGGRSGFTFMALVMLLFSVSLASLGIIASLTPALRSIQLKESEKKILRIKIAVSRFKADSLGAYPISLDNLAATDNRTCTLITDPVDPNFKKFNGWCGPYIDIIFTTNNDDFKTDGWGIPFQYANNTITSCGPNKSCGDSDDVVDSSL